VRLLEEEKEKYAHVKFTGNEVYDGVYI